MKKLWYHMTLGARCTWLHGDPRGFRDHDHRAHSSGDYKNRPPEGEHSGLHRYFRENSREPVSFELSARIVICRAFVEKILRIPHRSICTSVSEEHLHLLAELPELYEKRKKDIGRCKQHASHAVKDILPGKIWSVGGGFKSINDKSHLENTFDYIRTRQEPGTIVWSHRPDEDWLKNEQVGIILMIGKKKSTRLFPRSRP